MTESRVHAVTEVERRGLRDRVYERVLAMLLEGDVAPGSRLSIDTLAAQLDVSPTPVREALVQLERTGLVTREALKGYRVAPPLDAPQLDELFTARLMLEVEITRLAVPHASEILDDLREAHARHEEKAEQVAAAMRRGSVDLSATQEYFAADEGFHRVIQRAAHNRYLAQMYEGLGALTHRMRQTVVRGANDVEEAHQEHAAILSAFESGDRRAPVAAMRAHIKGVRARSLKDSEG